MATKSQPYFSFITNLTVQLGIANVFKVTLIFSSNYNNDACPIPLAKHNLTMVKATRLISLLFDDIAKLKPLFYGKHAKIAKVKLTQLQVRPHTYWYLISIYSCLNA